jgi:transcriptional regulator with XRE-family HTH domain
MPPENTYLKQLLFELKELREEADFTREQIEERLILGPGWIQRFEDGETIPNLDMLVAILQVIGKSFTDLFQRVSSKPDIAEIERFIYAEQNKKDLIIHFNYSKFDATYKIKNVKVQEYESIIKTLRDNLSKLNENENNEAIKTRAVVLAYLEAISKWKHINPSDLWYLLVYRAYCDPFNHPAQYARLDFSQSWKRTGGWALEEILVSHYGEFLKKQGITLLIASDEIKEKYLNTMKVSERLEADKMDVLLLGTKGTKNGVNEEIIFGVIHVKASFAERRTDDVPMSKALVDAGYVSPLWTMDCKSTPSARPRNRGELGAIKIEGEKDKRSAKRKDIEDDGYFSACFSYNWNTLPTPKGQVSKAKVIVCDFKNPDDEFSKFIVEGWKKFLTGRK